MKVIFTLSIWITFSLGSSVTLAATTPELDAIKATMMEMMSRIEALEAENKALKQQSSATVVEVSTQRTESTKKASSWAERIAMKGDVRYRYESIDPEGQSDRSRERVRARIQLDAQVSDNVTATVGLATGSSDPLSANQTLGGGGSSKNFGLNLAYFTWSATEDLDLIAGKYKNNFYKPNKSQMIFDNDYSPEGLALVWKKGDFFVNAAYQWLESDTKSNNDATMMAVQGGLKSSLGAGKLTAGLGYYTIGSEGREVFRGDADDFFGNSFACVDLVALVGCEYLEDYDMAQAFAHWSSQIGELPVTLYFDYIQNQAASDLDTAWGVGGSIGKVSGWKTWQIDYRYEDVEQDAAFGALSDSNFGGGGTGHTGHIVSGKFGITKNWELVMTYFLNENMIIGGPDTDYERFQFDTKFKF